MESDHQATIQENSEQQGGSPAAKSYECTFCKRGFSNAQALGGHMNIHRKDKAKLKQVSSSASNIIETKQQQQQQRAVLDIPKMPPLFPPILPPNINSNLLEANRPNKIISQDIDQRNSIRASSWPWFLNQEGHDTTTSTTVVRPMDHHHHHQNHDDHVQVHQLPFFSQRPSVPDHQNPGQNEKSVQPSDSDLDLELRLGPQDSSSSTANATRKFF